ncbi:tetratricopeptide repeat protein [Krasilnikovia sp. MM14-A1004]|uniref:tetratricopeptide repeat protein n=1 Tax=Krasilnikovia sp. MM14-A1004 TaxID=3373541 RepID=UPI00399C6222
MPSDAASAPFEPETTPEEYRQRSLLLADLGRYDEAAGELAAGLAAAPADPALLATLARVHLVAEQPVEALVAAERAVAAGPDRVDGLVARGMALVDNRRYAEAAQVAGAILGRWPADPYAQRTGAALLSEARNGQEALNAAWHGVRIAPADGEAHLVLAVVAARLRLFDLAQRAYAEALDLDSAIGEAQRDVGIVRLERRRWARALETLADEAALAQPPAPDMPDAALLPAPQSPAPQSPAVVRPAGPVLDPGADSATTVRQAVLYCANAVLVAGMVTGVMRLASPGASRVWAAAMGVLILVAVLVWLTRRLTEPLGVALRRLGERDRPLLASAYLAGAAPLLIVLHAGVGGVVPLVAAMVTAALAELFVLVRQ